MRAVLVAALGCVALAGCDQLGLGQHVAQIAPVPCHCTAAAAPVEQMVRLAPPVEHHRHHHHRYAESSHSYLQSWANEYEEQSPSDASESREYDERDEDRDSHEDVWVDGYGREHGYSHVTRVADARERHDPWHAYKSKCKDRDRERE